MKRQLWHRPAEVERKVAERTRQLELANRKLREEKVTLQISSITDGLTGLYNRTYVLDRFERELGGARRYDKTLSVIMFDLDHFKRVNDAEGHAAGDRVLVAAGEALRRGLRQSDFVARLGGDEFAVLIRVGQSEQSVTVTCSSFNTIRRPTRSFWPSTWHRANTSGK